LTARCSPPSSVGGAAPAIAVGATLAPDVTIPAAVYASFMLLSGGSFAWPMSRRNAPPAAGVGAKPALEPK